MLGAIQLSRLVDYDVETSGDYADVVAVADYE
jgi:hypothetical protein